MFQKLLYKFFEWKALFKKAQKVEEKSPDLCICTLFKNEAPFLKEWIEFHQKQGFGKFYVIDNYSNDSFQTVLQPYIEAGLVTLLQTNTSDMSTAIQAGEYNRAIKQMRRQEKEHTWVAFIDTDEFLFSVDEKKGIKEVLKDFSGQPIAAILVNWLMFGTADVEKLDEGKLLVEQLNKRAPDAHNEHHIFKSISYLPNIMGFVGGPHKPIAVAKAVFKYADGQLFSKESDKWVHTPLRINHYWYRSEEYYRTQKIEKRKVFAPSRDEKLEKWHKKRCNEVEDFEILKLNT